VTVSADDGPFGSATVAENYRRYLQPVIFEPWALRLIEFVGLAPGDTVLDVAAGTGAVARAAASAVGPGGRVIASDISAAMLAGVAEGADAAGAPIETLVCSATELAVADSSVDVVLCQHGFQFIADRTAAVREFGRVLRPGGVAGVAVWRGGVRMEPFDTYGEAMGELGIESGFGAVPNSRLSMSEADVAETLTAGGLEGVEVVTVSLDLRWASPSDAARGIAGTPFGAVVSALDDERREELFALLSEKFAGGGAPRQQRQTAVLGKGVARASR
jgi:SAM-dependent methyltransferase